MDLVSETTSEIYFHKTPVKLHLVLSAFCIAGIVIILFFGWRTELQCSCIKQPSVEDGESQGKRECGGWCNITKTNLWMFSEYKVATRSIRAAFIEGSGAAYRVALLLLTQEEEDPFVDDDFGGEQITILPYYSTSGYDTKRIWANKINSLLSGVWEPLYEGTDVVLQEIVDDRWLTYLVGIIFMLILLLAVLFSKREVCLLDKTENVLALIRNTAFTRKEEVYSLNEVSLVELHRNTQDRKTEYKVFFELEPSRSSVNSITTSSAFSGGTVVRHVIIETGNRWIGMCEEGSYATEEEAQTVCKQIRKFLGIPSLDDIMREKKKT